MMSKYNKIRNPFYVSTGWVKIRTAYINEYPLCRVCELKGSVTLATEVDHITPIRIDMNLSLEWDNLQSLCHRCHSKKTAAVDDRLLKGLEPRSWMGAGADGIPLDSPHW